MTEESPYPDEAISTLLGVRALPEGIREDLEGARGRGYAARCAALQRALGEFPEEARNAMTAEELSILSLGAAAAGAAARG